MAVDQWGRVIPDYSLQNYRDELLKQRDAIAYQLSEFDKRYQPQSQPIQQPSNLAGQTSKEPTQSYIIVSSEEEAFGYPIINNFEGDVGKVYFFVMNDESAVFAKRINRSTFDMEFEAYDRRRKIIKDDVKSEINNEWQSKVDNRLEAVERFIDNAISMFAGSDLQQKMASPRTEETNTVEPVIRSDIVEESEEE